MQRDVADGRQVGEGTSIRKDEACLAGPESAGVLGVGDGEVAAEAEESGAGGARLSCVGRARSPLTAASDTRFIASICSLFRPIRRFA